MKAAEKLSVLSVEETLDPQSWTQLQSLSHQIVDDTISSPVRQCIQYVSRHSYLCRDPASKHMASAAPAASARSARANNTS